MAIVIRLLGAAALLVGVGPSARPQVARVTSRTRAVADSAAEQTARRFFVAIDEQRWVDAARLIDLGPVEQQRQSYLQSSRQKPAHVKPPTVQDLRRHSPDMPLAVAEWQIQQIERENAKPWDRFLVYEFAGIHDIAGLAQASPLELGARWLEARDFRYTLRRAHEESPECGPLDVAAMPPDHKRIIGTIVRGDTAYVVYMPGDGSFEADGRPQLLVLNRARGSWIVSTDGTLFRQSMGGLGVVCGQIQTDTTGRDTLGLRR